MKRITSIYASYPFHLAYVTVTEETTPVGANRYHLDKVWSEQKTKPIVAQIVAHNSYKSKSVTFESVLCDRVHISYML